MPGSASRRTSGRSSTASPISAATTPSSSASTSSTCADTRTSTPFQLYTFADVAAYQAARSGANAVRLHHLPAVLRRARPRVLVEPLRVLRAGRLAAVADSLKVLYGLRYDLYDVPAAQRQRAVRGLARLRRRQEQLAPRARRGLDVGGDRPHGAARQHRPDVRPGAAAPATSRRSSTTAPTRAPPPASSRRSAGAPGVPERAVGRRRRRAQHADHGVDPDFQVASNWQNNVQVERQLGDRFAVAVGVVVRPRLQPAGHQQHQPDQPDRPAGRRPANLQHRGQRRDARRPALQRRSTGASRSASRPTRASPLQLTGRNCLGHAVRLRLHAGQERGQRADHQRAVGAGRRRPRRPRRASTATWGPTCSTSATPSSAASSRSREVDGGNGVLVGAIVNDTIFGLAMQFASGIPINIRSNREINNDGIASDRPLGVPRNSLNLPARYNVDLRCRGQFPLGGSRKVEVIAEVKNLFNTVQWAERDDDREHGRAGESGDRCRIAADAAGAGGDPAGRRLLADGRLRAASAAAGRAGRHVLRPRYRCPHFDAYI